MKEYFKNLTLRLLITIVTFTIFTVLTGVNKNLPSFYLSGLFCLTVYTVLNSLLDLKLRNMVEDVKGLTVHNYWKLKRELQSKLGKKSKH